MFVISDTWIPIHFSQTARWGQERWRFAKFRLAPCFERFVNSLKTLALHHRSGKAIFAKRTGQIALPAELPAGAVHRISGTQRFRACETGLAERVKMYAIELWLDERDQRFTELGVAFRGEFALEYRVLNAFAELD